MFSNPAKKSKSICREKINCDKLPLFPDYFQSQYDDTTTLCSALSFVPGTYFVRCMHAASRLFSWSMELLAFANRQFAPNDGPLSASFTLLQSDGIKSDLRIRWPNSLDFGPKSDDSTHRILKSKNGIGLQSSKNPTEQSRPGTAAVRGTHKSMSSDRCVGLRIQPRCANAVATPHRNQTTASCRSARART